MLNVLRRRAFDKYFYKGYTVVQITLVKIIIVINNLDFDIRNALIYACTFNRSHFILFINTITCYWAASDYTESLECYYLPNKSYICLKQELTINLTTGSKGGQLHATKV